MPPSCTRKPHNRHALHRCIATKSAIEGESSLPRERKMERPLPQKPCDVFFIGPKHGPQKAKQEVLGCLGWACRLMAELAALAVEMAGLGWLSWLGWKLTGWTGPSRDDRAGLN